MTTLAADRSVARARVNDVVASLAPVALTISFGLSYSVLIFSGPLAPYLSYGIVSTFVATASIAFVLALRSSFPFAIGAPESTTAAVTGTLASSVVAHLTARDPSAALLAPVLITLSMVTILTGIALFAFGLARIGRAIRYVPYPVIGGFLGATACLIIAGAVRVVTGHYLHIGTLGEFADPRSLYELLAAGLLALAIYLLWHRSRKPLALPATLIGGVIVAHVTFAICGVSLAEAQATGWTFAAPPDETLTLPWLLPGASDYPLDVLPSIIGDIVAVVFVTAIGTLFNTTGIEVATACEADLEGELRTHGIANIMSGLLGGYSGCISISRTILARSGGATGRLTGLTAALIAALMPITNPALLGYVPKFVLGGLLLYLGIEQLKRWLIDSRKSLTMIEYLSLVAIIVIIVGWGFIAGVLIGTMIGCLTFALSASRVNSIKYDFNGTEYRSSLDRSLADQALLTQHGRQILGLSLQSYLFFGSANRLYRHVKALLHRHPECRYLVIDFKLVTGIDSSAAYSFAQIKQTTIEQGVTLVLVNLGVEATRALQASQFISGDVRLVPELDHALEWCENEVIERHRGLEQEESDLRRWFGEIAGSEPLAALLADYCHRIDVTAGDIIARAGEPADSMHFILDGRIGIMVTAGDQRLTRVRSLGRYTSIGEMGLVSGQPRSATIQAETKSILYGLSGKAFETIKTEHPGLAQKLMAYFFSVMAERLNFANRLIGVLRR